MTCDELVRMMAEEEHQPMTETEQAPGIEAALRWIGHQLRSPNVPDRNGEPANLVDVGKYIADALYEIAGAIAVLAHAVQEANQ